MNHSASCSLYPYPLWHPLNPSSPLHLTIIPPSILIMPSLLHPISWPRHSIHSHHRRDVGHRVAQKCSPLPLSLRATCWPLCHCLSHFITVSDWKEDEHMTEDMFYHGFCLIDFRVMDDCLKETTGVYYVFNFAAGMGGMEFILCNHSMYSNATTSFSVLEASRIHEVLSPEWNDERLRKLNEYFLAFLRGLRGVIESFSSGNLEDFQSRPAQPEWYMFCQEMEGFLFHPYGEKFT